MIQVTNSTAHDVRVSVSSYGDGNEEYWTIKPGDNETWKRSDKNTFAIRAKVYDTAARKHVDVGYTCLYNKKIDIKGPKSFSGVLNPSMT